MITTFLVLISSTVLVWCSSEIPLWTTVQQDTAQDSNTNSWENGEALNVVTTFPPLFAHAANLIDDNDTLTNLVPPGTSVHFWQPKPSDVLAMEQADIIITNGLWLEEFLDDYLEWLDEKWVMIVDTSEWIVYKEYADEHGDEHDEHDEHDDEHDEHDDEHDEHDEHDHHHEWPDPHVRLDPSNAVIQVWNILEALTALDPSQEIFYSDQAVLYNDKISNVDSTLQKDISNTQVQPFIVFHDAYQYFLTAYNLKDKQVGLIQEFHGDNPSQKEIAALIQTIQDQWVQTIYTEPQFNPSIVQRLEQETWVTAREIDPIWTELSKEWYLTLIENLAFAFIKE